MVELTAFEKFKNALKAFFKKLLNTYKAEIKKYVAEQVDAQLVNLQSAVSDEVRKHIKNDVIASAIELKVDIYTTAGAETIKAMIAEYIDKLEGKMGE